MPTRSSGKPALASTRSTTDEFLYIPIQQAVSCGGDLINFRYLVMISKLAKTYLGATIPVVNVCGVIRPQL